MTNKKTTPKPTFPTQKELFSNLIGKQITKQTKSFNRELRKLNKPPKPEPPKTPALIRDENVLKAIGGLCSEYREAIFKMYAVIINEDQDKYFEHMQNLHITQQDQDNENEKRINLNAFTLMQISKGNGDFHTFPNNQPVLISRGENGFYFDTDTNKVDRGNYLTRLRREWKHMKVVSTREINEFLNSPRYNDFVVRLMDNNDIKRMLIDRLEVE